MKRFIRAAITGTLALTALASLTPRAEADHFRGRFNGFVESNILPAVQRGPAVFDVLTEQGTKFTGNLVNLIPPICNFRVKGSIGETGSVSGNGIDDDGDHVFFLGRTIVEGDGSVRVLALKYLETSPNGQPEDMGFIVMVKMQAGALWETPPDPCVPVTGHWDGLYQHGERPGGGISMDLTQILSGGNNNQGILATSQFTTSFMGMGSMTNVLVPGSNSFFDVFFDIQGTVGSPIMTQGPPIAPLGAICLQNLPLPNGKTGIIAILIGLLLPAVQTGPSTIQGQFHLFDSFHDLVNEVQTFQPAAFDRGPFSIMNGPSPGQ